LRLATLASRKTPGTVKLVAIGGIEHTERGRFILDRGLYGTKERPSIRASVFRLGKNANKALLLEMIKESDSKGSTQEDFEQVLLGHSRRQIQSLITELKNEGKIFSMGKTSATRWYWATLENSTEV
jgi:predicted HTH transcriptional regulator